MLFLLLPLIFIACKGSTGVDNDFNESFSSGSTGDSYSFENLQESSNSTPAISIVDEVAVVDTTLVESAGALPECGASNEGESFMVTSENTLYFCVSGEWRSDVVETVGVSCNDGVLSIGASNEVDASVFGVDSITGERVFRREGVALAGVSEKGPFHYGASVTVVELDSLTRLADSDRKHQACITSADGSYRFDAFDLVSPYVRVEASGYYKNELTGGLSTSPVTLTAVTDLTERDSVNVNMLTHLESFRTLKMIENTGNNQPIRSAKEQAFKDILYSFNIKVDGFNGTSFASGQTVATDTLHKTADDVRLFGDGDFSAALIAVSVMMQRKGSGDDMMSYVDGIAYRIRGNGNWDDWSARADLADWLMVLDTSGTYQTIRKNLESLKQGEVADFEKYLRNFWNTAFAFPTCNAETAGTVTQVTSSQSAFFACNYTDPNAPKVRFICDKDTYVWRSATDIEKDTMGLGADTTKYDGCFRAGMINTDKSYIYEESTNSWRPVTSADVMEFTAIEDVYATLASDEKVVFVLRHAERTDDTGETGHLTDNGKSQAQSVGAKFKGMGSFYLGYSGYTRTKETCENIALGAGVSSVSPVVIDGLDGDWYIKDASSYNNAKASGGGSLVVYTQYAYRALYDDAFYDLGERSKEFVSKYIISNSSKLQKVNFFITHDMMALPFTVYASERKVNLRYFDNRNWLNYLTGVAVIVNSAGSVRYVIVRGLDTGIMII